MIERPTLIVMAKAPRVGLGKSRLAVDIGLTEAWRMNRALHAQTLRVACDRRWETLLCVTPDAAAVLDLPGVWPRELGRITQGKGDLGERLARALAPHRHVAVIGTDCPKLTRTHLASAFQALKRASFVLGPARDGGFWLLAARAGAAAALAMGGVRWSSRHTTKDVLRNLGARNVAVLATLSDIDVAADLPRQRSATRRSSGA
jgi:rSAM/selenodomain-associated transferase 1